MARALPHRDGYLDAEIILAHLSENEATPFVTWQRNVKDGSTYWGHYFTDLREALDDFESRGARSSSMKPEEPSLTVTWTVEDILAYWRDGEIDDMREPTREEAARWLSNNSGKLQDIVVEKGNEWLYDWLTIHAPITPENDPGDCEPITGLPWGVVSGIDGELPPDLNEV